MDNSASRVGSGEISFNWNRGVSITAGVLLLITGVAIVTLGATGSLGQLRGIGAITCMTLGGLDVLAVLTICLIGAGYKISKLKSPIAKTTHSPEKLNLISWKCGSETSRKRLSFIQEDKELSCGKWENYDPRPEEKLVVVIHVNDRQAFPTNGEENSPEYLVVKKFQEKMGDNLLVLIDVEEAGEYAKTKQPADLISKDPIWGTMFRSNRCICTNESNWQERLDAFIAK